MGGIVGRNESEGTIDHSTARAIVTGKSSTGGIAGYNLGAITGCTNVGSINTEYQEASSTPTASPPRWWTRSTTR